MKKAVPEIGNVYIENLDDWEALEKTIAEGDILVKATRAGMSPLQDVMPVPAEFLHKDLVVADVVYNPSETLLLKKEVMEKFLEYFMIGLNLLFPLPKYWANKAVKFISSMTVLRVRPDRHRGSLIHKI